MRSFLTTSMSFSGTYLSSHRHGGCQFKDRRFPSLFYMLCYGSRGKFHVLNLLLWFAFLYMCTEQVHLETTWRIARWHWWQFQIPRIIPECLVWICIQARELMWIFVISLYVTCRTRRLWIMLWGNGMSRLFQLAWILGEKGEYYYQSCQF